MITLTQSDRLATETLYFMYWTGFIAEIDHRLKGFLNLRFSHPFLDLAYLYLFQGLWRVIKTVTRPWLKKQGRFYFEKLKSLHGIIRLSPVNDGDSFVGFQKRMLNHAFFLSLINGTL